MDDMRLLTEEVKARFISSIPRMTVISAEKPTPRESSGHSDIRLSRHGSPFAAKHGLPTTMTGLFTPWCFPTMTYAVFHCDDYLFYNYCVGKHGRIKIACDARWATIASLALTSGRDSHLWPDVVNCLALSTWYAKQTPVALVFTGNYVSMTKLPIS